MRRWRGVRLFALCLLAAGGAMAEPSANSAPSPEIVLWLEGDSTLHPYSSTATQVEIKGGIEFVRDAGALAPLFDGGVLRLEVIVPVESLKSGKKGLDKNMYENLKSEKFPNIVFSLSSYKADKTPEGALAIRAQGQLTVAGQTREVELEAQGRIDGEKLRVSGSKELLMTDFGIKPPTMMLGAIKTDNKVVVHYRISLPLRGAEK